MKSAERQCRVELLKLALRNIVDSAVPPPLVVVLVTIALYRDDIAAGLIAWGTMTILTGFFYVYSARRRLADEFGPDQHAPVMWHLMASSSVLGGCWAALPWVALSPGDTAGEVLIIAVTTGVAATAVATLSAVFPAFLAFVVTEMAGLIGKFVSLEGSIYPVLSIAALFYMASLIGMALNGAKSARSGIILRFENLELLDKLEEEKRHAEEANRAKSKFLAAASHDLRQPVHAQGLFMDVLGNSGLSRSQRELLDHARDAWGASVDMLNTLLDFSRIEASTVEPRPKPFHLQPLLGKLESEFGHQANRAGLFYRSRDTALATYSDPVLVELILRNLIANAIRYTSRGGLLIGCRQRGGRVVIEVWDTGIGIAAHQREEIFQPFFQVDNSERDRRNGLGLGLAIADGLADALQATLSLASSVGRGSVFRLSLPLAEAEVTVPFTASPPQERRPLDLRVLVIDDDETVRRSMLRLLGSWGCACRAAESIAEARRAAAAATPELIVSDYRLRAGETGFEAVVRLRADAGRELPALLITGDTSPECLRQAATNGVALLHKPISAEQLYLRIVALVGDSDTESP